MILTLDPFDGYVLAAVTGSIDSTTVDDFARQVRPVVESQNTDLFIDLSETDYVNSDGLGAFIQLSKAAESHSRRFVLVSPNPQLREVLSMTRLDTLLHIVDDVKSAIAPVENN